MSIHPEFVNRILTGDKLVEFRRTKFKKSVRFVVVYACAPVKAVVGFFAVEGIEEGSPDEIWKRFSAVGGVDEKQYRLYFAGSELAYAIRIGEVTEFKNPVNIEVVKSFSPPQSFMYISDSTLELLTRESR